MCKSVVFWTVAILLLSSPWLSWEQCLSEDDSVSTTESKSHVTKLQEGSTKFAIKLIQDVTVQNTGTSDNILISPISLWAALTVTYLGARGKTATELETALNVQGVRKPDLANAYEDFRDELLHNATSTSNYTFDLANKLYFDKNVPMKECIGQTNLISQLEKVDFVNKLEESRQAINKWVEGKTNDKIKELIRASDVDTTTNMIIVNAAYFKGFWKKEFKFTIADTDFFVKPNQPVKVEMMVAEGQFRVGDNQALDCAAVELPYVGEEVSMVILLPNTNVEELIPKLTPENVKGLYQELKPATLSVNVPKFKFEQDTDLKFIVQGMGVNDMFAAGIADFSGFTGDRKSYVDFIRQKAFIDVNEIGTEAAAATSVGFTTLSAFITNRGPFICNKPFVFFIRNNKTGTLLFSGVVRKPEYKKQ